ncbi:MAG: class I SAM-dependent methyltransferase [Acidobacteria bacterium]|nr:class I SAM-dependent methyltransferase [Acidobacteriota bacterium]
MSTEKQRACSIPSLEQERLERTFAALPADISNGLEIGCYDFLVTDRLRARMDLVSIDLPRRVPAHQGYKLAFADIQDQPFRDRAFDVVFCTEVLEHLPPDVLASGVKEMQRVCRRYILVTVPYRQRVWNENARTADS